MTVQYQSPSMTLLVQPDERELRAHLPAPAVPKILRHLDPATGDAAKGEIQCTRILEVICNPWSVRVHYETLMLGGKKGSQFMNFFPWSAVMRCLAVTTDGRVVLIQQYRRTRGGWVEMHVAGGVREGGPVDAVRDELFEESGCRLTDRSRILLVEEPHADDGVFSDPLPLLAVDHVQAPEAHQNPDEEIRGIVLKPWAQWRREAITGRARDVYATVFAARCRFDQRTGRISLRGISLGSHPERILREPARP